MYEGILQKDESGTWYTSEGEALTDVQSLLDGLPPGSKLFLQASDGEEASSQEEEPTALERARQKKQDEELAQLQKRMGLT